MKLSDQIRDAVKRTGESVYSVALAIQMDEMSLRRFMRGEVGLSTRNLDRLAAHCGLKVIAGEAGQSDAEAR